MGYEYGHCSPDDLDELNALANEVFRAGRGGDMRREYPLLLTEENAANLLVARHEGRIVSHVGLCVREATILGARLRIGLIGAVCTHPQHRGQGTATVLMNRARELAISQGACLMLISGDRGLYKRLGYVEAGEYDAISLSPAEMPEEGAYDIQPAGEADLRHLAMLYQGEPVRWLRPLRDWSRLLQAGMLMNRTCGVALVRQGDRPLAYAAYQQAVHRDEFSGGQGVARVLEHAGSRRALVAALSWVRQQTGADAVQIAVPAHDPEWAALATPWSVRRVGMWGTAGILDPETLLEAIRPLLAERLPGVPLCATGNGFLLRLGGAEAEIAANPDFTRLLFGGPGPEPDVLATLPSLLRGVVRASLPLPLPWYGFNYV